MPRSSLSGRSPTWTFALVLGLLSAPGCGAIFPETQTRISEAPASGNHDPKPPEDRLRFEIVGATIPSTTRDGREWSQAFGSLPKPYLRIIVNGAELLKTLPEDATLAPRWAKAPKGNFKIAAGDDLEVQLWSANFLNDTPMGTKKVRVGSEMVSGGETELELTGGAIVTLRFGPAEAVWGAGFTFDVRGHSAYVKRLHDASPASRAGMLAGDEIVSLNGRGVDTMSPAEVKSVLGSFPVEGVKMTLRHSDDTSLEVVVKEGPIYPLHTEYKKFDVAPR